MYTNPSDDALRHLLQNAKTIAIVGLSDTPTRDSYQIGSYLMKHGYQVIPVNPTVNRALGVESVKSLSELPDNVDLVNVFRRSDTLVSLVEEFVATTIPTIWTQLGIVHEDAANQALQHGKQVVMDRCIMVEHRRLIQV